MFFGNLLQLKFTILIFRPKIYLNFQCDFFLYLIFLEEKKFQKMLNKNGYVEFFKIKEFLNLD